MMEVIQEENYILTKIFVLSLLHEKKWLGRKAG